MKRWGSFISLILIVLPMASYGVCKADKKLRKDFTFDDLSEYMSSNKGTLKSVTDLLWCLPDEYRKNFTLAYKSDAPEGVDMTYQTPRVLMFGETGNPILAFTGNSGGKSFNKMQVISRDGNMNNFYEVSYRDYSSAKGPKVLSHRDHGANCTSCHANDLLSPNKLKPIWSNYPVWPGYYGSEEDSIEPSAISTLQTSYASHRRSTELENLTKFMKKGSVKGPYAALDFDRSSKYGPYTDVVGGDFSKRPNARLQILLVNQNLQRIMSQLKNCPQYDENKHLLAALLLARKSPRLKGDQSYCNIPEEKVDNPEKKNLSTVLEVLLAKCDVMEEDFSLAHYEDRHSDTQVDQVLRTFEESNRPYTTRLPHRAKSVAEKEKRRKEDWNRAKSELLAHGKKSQGLDYWNGGETTGNMLLAMLLKDMETDDREIKNKYVKKFDYEKLKADGVHCGISVDETTWTVTEDKQKKDSKKCVAGLSILSELTTITDMKKRAPYLLESQQIIKRYQSAELGLCEHLVSQIPKDAITKLFAPVKKVVVKEVEEEVSVPVTSCMVPPTGEVFVPIVEAQEISEKVTDELMAETFKTKCLSCHANGTPKDLRSEKYRGKVAESVRSGKMPLGKSKLEPEEKINMEAYLRKIFNETL